MSRAERGGKQLQEEMFSVALRFAYTKGTIENTYFINNSIPLPLYQRIIFFSETAPL